MFDYLLNPPKHRRVCHTDARPTARCTSVNADFCLSLCPRHRAADYAENMARHSVDSIRPTSIGPVR